MYCEKEFICLKKKKHVLIREVEEMEALNISNGGNEVLSDSDTCKVDDLEREGSSKLTNSDISLLDVLDDADSKNGFNKAQDDIVQEVLSKLTQGEDVFHDNDTNDELNDPADSGNMKKINKNIPKDDTGKATYSCEICGRSFLYVSKLRYHERIHTNYRPHKCSTCGRGFLEKSALKQHYTTHTKEKNFHCTACPKTFSSSSNLSTHIKRLHETDPDKIKKFTCEICFRVTSTAFNLKVHYQTHTGVKQYSCDVCHLFFAHKTSLNVHKKIHTGEISKQCEYCNKTFVSNSNYHRHVRMHRGEKPFSCPECSKVFSDSSNLSKHRRIHTGEKLYACHLCDNLYTFSNHLSRHKKRCHPELQAAYVKLVELPIEVEESEVKKEENPTCESDKDD